ncbi:protein-tyrosine-phosphatase MKP1-like [Apium graveolens]|uniref:protein-tyrosine-phosphatase MKP1-like n=1 Tax=Apium graveolens TaxID=4045 RepID=UPI003D7B3613
MLSVEDNDRRGSRKTYSRSASWSDRSPTNPIPRPQLNNKARACLPPLQPLAISRPKAEEWPRAGSDDLGVWPNPTTPGVGVGMVKVPWNNSEQSPREFEFRRDKIAFFEKDCSRIADHVYLGSDAVAKNREILRQNGITHVLNCVGFVCPEYFKSDLVYKTLWLRDSPTEDITSILYDVFDYFEDVREQGGRVLVHCCQGVSRSTSLVIAYLMWKNGQSFEDAFQHVKAARGVANPNMGFACQLLQCQKRVHAIPASPNSVLRMYRMAPHSPYDPLHLVPKLLSHPRADALDSRGAFIVHVPSIIYLWIGQGCVSVMSDSARTAALQVIRYEKAQGFISIIREGEESSEFWSALQIGADTQEGRPSSGSDEEAALIRQLIGQRKVNDYDLDFDIFHQASSGGVVPPSALFRAGSETSLPARENGWGRLRRKFANGIMKEFIASSKLSSDTPESSDTSDMAMDTSVEVESPVSSLTARSLDQISDNRTENTNIIPGPLSSPSPRHISSFHVNNSKFSALSPSLSPSTSDYSSPFTFSPSSSNWSDLSYPSAQPSPSGLGPTDLYEAKKDSLEENAFSSSYAFKNTYFPCKGTSPSIAERRGTYPPPQMMLPSLDKVPQKQANLPRSWSFSSFRFDNDLTSDTECIYTEPKADVTVADGFQNPEEGENSLFHTPSSDMVEDIAEATSSVLYQWPSMNEVQREHFELNSESVYLIFVPDLGFSLNSRDVIYIWVGQEVSSDEKVQTMDCDGMCEDGDIQWEAIGYNFIANKKLAADSIVQVVKEGEEPERLLEHLNCFSFHKAKEQSNN